MKNLEIKENKIEFPNGSKIIFGECSTVDKNSFKKLKESALKSGDSFSFSEYLKESKVINKELKNKYFKEVINCINNMFKRK